MDLRRKTAIYREWLIHVTKIDPRPVLYIVRGLPGSGKTTYAKQLMSRIPNVVHFEADMFRYNAAGEYVYDHDKPAKAHNDCYDAVRDILVNTTKSVVVANTFINTEYVRRYIELVQEVGCRLAIHTCRGNYGSTHEVPDDVMARMRLSWTELDGEIFV